MKYPSFVIVILVSHHPSTFIIACETDSIECGPLD